MQSSMDGKSEVIQISWLLFAFSTHAAFETNNFLITPYYDPSPGKPVTFLLILGSWIHAQPPLACDIIMTPGLLMTTHQSDTITPWCCREVIWQALCQFNPFVTIFLHPGALHFIQVYTVYNNVHLGQQCWNLVPFWLVVVSFHCASLVSKLSPTIANGRWKWQCLSKNYFHVASLTYSTLAVNIKAEGLIWLTYCLYKEIVLHKCIIYIRYMIKYWFCTSDNRKCDIIC